MLILDHKTLSNMPIAPLDYYRWVEEAFLLKKDAQLPPKMSMRPKDNDFYTVMPCILPKQNIMGVKVVSRISTDSKNTPSLNSQILLYDLCTGELLSLMDGNLITAMRTGAVACHSLNLFANPSFQTIGMMGLGITARATLDILLHLYPERKMDIKLLRYKNTEQFASRYKTNRNLTFSIAPSPQETIANSDIVISSVTYADQNFAHISFYKTGCTVIPIHTMGFQNCDTEFEKVFADDTEHVRSFKHFNDFKSFAEVVEVVQGEKKGRENNQERLLIYNVGIALHDIYFAHKYYRLADATATNKTTFDFSVPNMKNWLD